MRGTAHPGGDSSPSGQGKGLPVSLLQSEHSVILPCEFGILTC